MNLDPHRELAREHVASCPGHTPPGNKAREHVAMHTQSIKLKHGGHNTLNIAVLYLFQALTVVTPKVVVLTTASASASTVHMFTVCMKVWPHSYCVYEGVATQLLCV